LVLVRCTNGALALGRSTSYPKAAFSGLTPAGGMDAAAPDRGVLRSHGKHKPESHFRVVTASRRGAVGLSYSLAKVATSQPLGEEPPTSKLHSAG